MDLEWLWLLVPLGLVALAFAAARRRRHGSGPSIDPNDANPPEPSGPKFSG